VITVSVYGRDEITFALAKLLFGGTKRPTPDNPAVVGLPTVSLKTLNIPLWPNALDGVNVTVMVQVLFATSVEGQLFPVIAN
jgi:hypothetical protein